LEVDYPQLRQDLVQDAHRVFVDPKTTTPLSFLMAESAFDRLAQAHPKAEILISLVGLPLNVRASTLWRQSERRRLALLLPDWRMVGGAEEIREAVKSEKIAAAVMNRPGVRNDEGKKVGDYREEFERRFVLVTKANIDDLLRSCPQLFSFR
jgi:hypothetical protein